MSLIASQITSLTIVYSKLRVTGLCERNSPVTGEFHAQRASDAEMLPFDDVIMIPDLSWFVLFGVSRPDPYLSRLFHCDWTKSVPSASEEIHWHEEINHQSNYHDNVGGSVSLMSMLV